MSGRLRSCSHYRRELLSDRWEMAASDAAESSRPPSDCHWLPATAPGTVASALRASGRWSTAVAPEPPLDSKDWWFRRRFEVAPHASDERLILGFDGLATLAEIWLNGSLLGKSNNMFVAQQHDVTDLVTQSNELTIRFNSLDKFLAIKRPRPRWRTPMVGHPQLRWVRTTLLGRTPGWSVPAPPVGPWRPVWLERRAVLDLQDCNLSSSLNGRQGSVRVQLAASTEAHVRSAVLSLRRNGRTHSVGLDIREHAEGAVTLSGALELADVDVWWPHTHGQPALYEAEVHLTALSNGTAENLSVGLGKVGFRTVSLDRTDGNFALRVNGERIFCRGAIWTPLDSLSLSASPAQYADALNQARAGGFNMLRVAGPFIYESDELLDACDQTGMLLWQDFMFANMDYPAADPDFLSGVRTEATQVLQRAQARPSLAMLCGNSEVYQQAAMSGAARELWAAPLFEETLAALAGEYCADVPYCPSSTYGGQFPFSPNEGVTSYYGVGAYLRPLDDARRSGVRFASECLAFANVPESETLSVEGGTPLHFNQPRWKERVARDLGAGWDFDDVRDRYLERIFGVEAAALRYTDQRRYLQLSRVVTGEVMAAAFAEWRRARSTCNGALILFLRDLWPGAGWGLIDSTGLPKAAYYSLKRTLQATALFATDEGANGVALHLANDGPTEVSGQLQLALYKSSRPVGRPASQSVSVKPHSVLEMNATQLSDGFVDLSYYYRFGPCSYDVLHAVFTRDDGKDSAEAFYFPTGSPGSTADVGLQAQARLVDNCIHVDIESRDFAQSVHVEAPGYLADDQYFHLAPRARRTVRFLPRSGQAAAAFEGTVRALNCGIEYRIDLNS